MKIDILDGIYAVESDETNFWYWANSSIASLKIVNDESEDKDICFEFNAILPPGINKREFVVESNSFEVKYTAPCTFIRNIRISKNTELDIKIRIKGKAVCGYNGDARSLMLMLQNMKVYEAKYYSKALRKIQNVEIDLLQKVVDVCEKNQLHCYLFYGSLLGGIRNGGIIPWDDDVDIVLLRKDYDILIKKLQTEFQRPYVLQTVENTKDIFWGGYSKFRNLNTTGAVIDKDIWKVDNQGIWIDIMPLDYLVSDSRARKKQFNRISFVQKLINYNIKSSKNSMLHDYLSKKLNKLFRLGSENEEYVTILSQMCLNTNPRFYSKQWFDGMKTIEFEGIKINIPSDYDSILKELYGKNYNIIPHESQRMPHHNAIYRVDVPWKEFSSKIIRNENLDGKEIILVGSIENIKKYCTRFSLSNVKYIIDDENAGYFYKNIMILNFNQGTKCITDDLFFIICDNYINMENKLLSFNIANYGFFYNQNNFMLCENNYLSDNEEE